MPKRWSKVPRKTRGARRGFDEPLTTLIVTPGLRSPDWSFGAAIGASEPGSELRGRDRSFGDRIGASELDLSFRVRIGARRLDRSSGTRIGASDPESEARSPSELRGPDRRSGARIGALITQWLNQRPDCRFHDDRHGQAMFVNGDQKNIRPFLFLLIKEHSPLGDQPTFDHPAHLTIRAVNGQMFNRHRACCRRRSTRAGDGGWTRMYSEVGGKERGIIRPLLPRPAALIAAVVEAAAAGVREGGLIPRVLPRPAALGRAAGPLLALPCSGPVIAAVVAAAAAADAAAAGTSAGAAAAAGCGGRRVGTLLRSLRRRRQAAVATFCGPSGCCSLLRLLQIVAAVADTVTACCGCCSSL